MVIALIDMTIVIEHYQHMNEHMTVVNAVFSLYPANESECSEASHFPTARSSTATNATL